MSRLTVAATARASAPFYRRVQQQGWQARLCAPRPRQATTTALLAHRLASSSSRRGGSSSRSSGGWGIIPLAPGASILLAAALLCSPSAQSPAEAGWWPFSRGRQPTSPLEDPLPRKAKRQRARAEREMREYLAKMRVPLQQLIAGLRRGEVRLSSHPRFLHRCEHERLNGLASLWYHTFPPSSCHQGTTQGTAQSFPPLLLRG